MYIIFPWYHFRNAPKALMALSDSQVVSPCVKKDLLVERPDPKKDCIGHLTSCPPPLELGALTKWLAN
jgi:hypothetical protein